MGEESKRENTDWVELGPSTEAKRVRDSVLIEERRGNLVKHIFIGVEDWEKIGELFGRSVDSGTDWSESDRWFGRPIDSDTNRSESNK